MHYNTHEHSLWEFIKENDFDAVRETVRAILVRKKSPGLLTRNETNDNYISYALQQNQPDIYPSPMKKRN